MAYILNFSREIVVCFGVVIVILIIKTPGKYQVIIIDWGSFISVVFILISIHLTLSQTYIKVLLVYPIFYCFLILS